MSSVDTIRIKNADGTTADYGISTDADKISFTPGTSGLTSTNAQTAIVEVNSNVSKINNNLINEDNEKFIFGIKDGKRGFYTEESRGADSFVPFNVDGEYLRFNEDTGYIQAQNDAGEWINLYSTSSLPIKSFGMTSLGSAKTYDIKTLLPHVDYTQLTLSDFIITGIPLTTIDHAYKEVEDYPTDNYFHGVASKVTPYISYDNSTGILTAYADIYLLSNDGYYSEAWYQRQASTTDSINSTAYFVEKSGSGNLISLGKNTSFDIKTLVPDIDYKSLKTSDFVITNIFVNAYSKGAYPPGDKGHAEVYITPYNTGYDASTGILTAYFNYMDKTVSGGYQGSTGHNANYGAIAYLKPLH